MMMACVRNKNSKRVLLLLFYKQSFQFKGHKNSLILISSTLLLPSDLPPPTHLYDFLMVMLKGILGGNVSNIQHQCTKLARLPGVWCIYGGWILSHIFRRCSMSILILNFLFLFLFSHFCDVAEVMAIHNMV
jgi:hypothetical protein